MSVKTDNFIRSLIEYVSQATPGTGIFPSVALGMAALEMGWKMPTYGNNVYNIKPFGPKGPFWSGDTVINNGDGLQYRSYPSIRNSVFDFIDFLQRNQRYTKAGVFTANTPQEQVDRIKQAGYAEGPQYAPIVKKIIADYNLERYDNTLPVVEIFGKSITNESTQKKKE